MIKVYTLFFSPRADSLYIDSRNHSNIGHICGESIPGSGIQRMNTFLTLRKKVQRALQSRKTEIDRLRTHLMFPLEAKTQKGNEFKVVEETERQSPDS